MVHGRGGYMAELFASGGALPGTLLLGFAPRPQLISALGLFNFQLRVD
jgi:hypothetical protein